MVFLSGCSQIKEKKLFGGKSKEIKLAPLKKITPTLTTKKAWEVNTGHATGDNKIHPYIDNTAVYVAGGTSASAWQLNSGKKLWSTVIGENITAGINGSLLANPQSRAEIKSTASQIFLGTNSGNAISLDAKSGKIQWIERLSSEVLSVSPSENGRVGFRTVDGKLHGLDAKTGELIWQRAQKTPALTQLGANVPIIVSNYIVAGFDNGKIAAYELQNGTPVWEIPLSIPSGNPNVEQMVDVDGRIKVLGNKLYATSLNGSSLSMNLQTGEQVWIRAFSSPSGVEANEAVLFSSDDKGNVWALDTLTGDPIWSMDDLAGRQPSLPVLVNNSTIVVTDSKGNIHFLNVQDAKFRARLKGDLRGFTVEPTIKNNSVYTFGRSGVLTKITL